MKPPGSSSTWLATMLVAGIVGVPCSVGAAGTVAAATAGQDEPAQKWIKHRIVPRETWGEIADRYGVSIKALQRWNAKRVGPDKHLIAGRTLRVYARRFPPPRELTYYIVQRGDTWPKIAARYGVDQDDLRAWNRKVPRKFKAGRKLKIYTNPSEPDPDTPPGQAGPLPSFDVRPGGIAIGKPNRGKLQRGVQMPDSDLYTLRKPEYSYGTSHAVLQTMKAIAQFRRQTGFEGEVVIGSMSRKSGGRFRPHSSHQTGRDVDIRLPKLAGVPKGKAASIDEIDWLLSWKLIKAFVATGEVEYIFLAYGRQRRLYRAASNAGASEEELRELLQFPRGQRTNNGIVRHSDGHDAHIHVRIKCTPGNARCLTY